MKKALILLTIFIFTFSTSRLIVFAEESEGRVVIPVSASMSKGTFSFVLSEDESLDLNTTVDTPDEILELEFLDAPSQKSLDFGSDVVIVASLTPTDYDYIKEAVESVITNDSSQQKVVFDITVHRQIDGTSEEITAVDNKIKFRINAPDDFDGSKVSEVKIVSVHPNGDNAFSVFIIPVEYEQATNTLCFDVDCFSSFALFYASKTIDDDPPGQDVNHDSDIDKPTDDKPKDNTPKDDISSNDDKSTDSKTDSNDNSSTGVLSVYIPPSSGDTSDSFIDKFTHGNSFQTGDNIWIYVAIGVLIVAVVTLIISVKQGNKDEKDKKAESD